MRWLLLQPPFIQMNQVLELRETEKLSQHHRASKWQSQIRNFSVRLQSLGCSCSQEALRDSLFSAYQVTPTFLGTAVLSRVQLFVTPWTVCSPPGFSVHEISQERIQEWVTISFSRGIFLTQGSNPHLLNLLLSQMDSLPLMPPCRRRRHCAGGA